MKRIVLGLMMLVFTINLYGYSYAAAGKEPTLDAKEAILKSINDNDFNKAKKVFDANKKNYQYLNDEFNEKLFIGLKTSIENEDKVRIAKWLDISVASEIERRLDGGIKNIKKFNIAKVMLAKANKFYKILSPSLDEKSNQLLGEAIKNCILSIGNPGLFGVGAKPADAIKYKENQKIAIKVLKSL